MDNTAKIVILLVVGFLAWLLLFKQKIVASNGQDQDNQNLPWYLIYNTSQPSSFQQLATVMESSSGIQNTSAAPCSVCSIFGASYASQY